MNRNDKPDPHLDDEDDDGESHAADEPTAVWDESALRAAGLTDLLSKRKSDPPPAPATKSTMPDRPSIEVSQDVSLQAQLVPPVQEPQFVAEPAAPPSNSMGWGATLGLAVLLGAVVYAVIRFVKG